MGLANPSSTNEDPDEARVRGVFGTIVSKCFPMNSAFAYGNLGPGVFGKLNQS